MPEFKIVSDFMPTGDQPDAVNALAAGVSEGLEHQTLLGVTGSGKTFTMACVVEQVQKPTLVIAHNKTLAAQLASEFKEFFPDNAVEYFVSYYDYYQPEAYVPRTDTYIEKDADINEELDKLRHSATRALLTRQDVLIVASVSCIFGLGSPEEYQGFVASIRKGEIRNRSKLIRQLVDMQYERNDFDLARGRFRVKGDTLEILPAYEELGVRIEFWGDEIDRIIQLDPLTGEILSEKDYLEVYPAKHFVTSQEKLNMAIRDIQDELSNHLKELKGQGKLLEAQRLESRTNYDMEMLEVAGYCGGVENYSRHLSQRAAGSTPYTLMDYIPDDFLLFVDESHMTIPQIRGMYKGDRSRKETLVEYGFRLPSALDNRPLNFEEFEERVHQSVYVSATPGPYEMQISQNVVEQVIRPTGLLDPVVEIKPVDGQIDDLLFQVNERVEKGERCLVTTLTKRMAEELSDYLKESGVRTHYLHSEIDTLERVEILRDLRLGVYDVIVGINLLREGLDLPEVSLVAILDADKEGYLRSSTALIQTIGRAARHIDGKVIMYADVVTKSMKHSIEETERRRQIQEAHNRENGITAQGIRKTIHDITERVKSVSEPKAGHTITTRDLPREDIARLIKDLESQMKSASRSLEFEKAALLRDQVIDLRKVLVD
ncbi:MAG: excinuclease ABC subunit B [SAR202 cluster bacterium Io17-Chloro-G3]|nr:MAG: excinuclease ABC subunit B [SAR202 cluster bacterium Io17-Chloro-G3]